MEEKPYSPIFACKSICKQFDSTVALNQVDMVIHPGEIVGLIGENGAGKSTLLKIIMGFQPQTSGTMYVRQKRYTPSKTTDASKAGIGMVYQEQSLLTNMSVAQNIYFGREDPFRIAGIGLNWAKMNRAAKEALEYIGNTTIEPQKTVLAYNFSLRQQIEIAKVLSTVRDSGISNGLIMFDEPTSLLSDAEVEALFAQIRKLKEQGHSVIFVSHRLDEVLNISDRIYVFKDGEVVHSLPSCEANEEMLYKMMVGKDSSGEFYQIHEQNTPNQTMPLLEVQNLGLKGVFKNVSFSLHEGEIMGICGVIGSGKEEVCNVICGDIPPTSGIIKIKQKQQTYHSPCQARRLGILSVPKERRIEGMVGIMSIEENIALSSLKRLMTGILLKRKNIRRLYQEWKERLNIKCPGPTAMVQSLSGGNAQKVVFSRVLASGCELLILNHPTRGVDIGAKEEIYRTIRRLAKQGKGILLLCDTIEETIGLANQILVMKDGLITKTLCAEKENKPSKLAIIEHMM